MLRLTNIGNLSTYNSATGLFEKITNCNIDIENDKIIDTSGNKNVGIMIGDYSVQKRSTLVPLTREMNMKLPETDNEDKAI